MEGSSASSAQSNIYKRAAMCLVICKRWKDLANKSYLVSVYHFLKRSSGCRLRNRKNEISEKETLVLHRQNVCIVVSQKYLRSKILKYLGEIRITKWEDLVL